MILHLYEMDNLPAGLSPDRAIFDKDAQVWTYQIHTLEELAQLLSDSVIEHTAIYYDAGRYYLITPEWCGG